MPRHVAAAIGAETGMTCCWVHDNCKTQHNSTTKATPTGSSTPVCRKRGPPPPVPHPRRPCDPAEGRSTRTGPVWRHHLCMRQGVPGTGGTDMKNSWAAGHRGRRDGAFGVPEMQGTPARPRNTDDEVNASLTHARLPRRPRVGCGGTASAIRCLLMTRHFFEWHSETAVDTRVAQLGLPEGGRGDAVLTRERPCAPEARRWPLDDVGVRGGDPPEHLKTMCDF